MESEKAGNPPPYQPESVNFVDGPPPPIVPGPAIVPMVPVAMVQMAPQVGSQPQGMRCRSCNAEIVTAIKHNSTTKTHLFAALLCIIGCWPCVCIPYCMDSCKNIDHYCPNCDAYIGTYKG